MTCRSTTQLHRTAPTLTHRIAPNLTANGEPVAWPNQLRLNQERAFAALHHYFVACDAGGTGLLSHALAEAAINRCGLKFNPTQLYQAQRNSSKRGLIDWRAFLNQLRKLQPSMPPLSL